MVLKWTTIFHYELVIKVIKYIKYIKVIKYIDKRVTCFFDLLANDKKSPLPMMHNIF